MKLLGTQLENTEAEIEIPDPKALHHPYAEALRQKGALLARKAELDEDRGRVLAEIAANATGQKGATSELRKLAEQLINSGRMSPGRKSRDRLEAVNEEIEFVKAALLDIEGIIRNEKGHADALVCRKLKGDHDKLQKAVIDALLTLHAQHLAFERFLIKVERAGISSTFLRSARPFLLGSPFDRQSPLGHFLKDAIALGYIGRDGVPEEIR